MNCNFCLTYDSSEKVSDVAVGRGVVRKSERGAVCVRNEINVKIRSAPLPSAAAKGGRRGVRLSSPRATARPRLWSRISFFPRATIFFFFLLHSMWRLSTLTESKALFHFDGSDDVRALCIFGSACVTL